jgi:hypothetical protein
MNEYKLCMSMVWHESTNPATTTAMEQRAKDKCYKTISGAEGPTKWQDQRSKKMT